MAITYPVADQELIERLEIRLQEFRKLRVGYIDPNLDNKEKEAIKIETVEKKKKIKARSLVERFFFSEYH